MTVYGDLNHVKRILRPDPDSIMDEDVDARLAQIQVAVSAAMEQRMGRSFGTTADDTEHTVYAGGSPVLLLPVPARSITSVTLDDVEVDADLYVADPVDYATGLIWGLRSVSGSDWGWCDEFNRPLAHVVVVGDFGTSDDDAVIPDEVQYVANRLIAATYQIESSSPQGGIGFDGEIVRPPDPWKDTLVKAVLDAYRAQSKQAVVF